MTVVDRDDVCLGDRLAGIEVFQQIVGDGEFPTNGVGRLIDGEKGKCPDIAGTATQRHGGPSVRIERIGVRERDRAGTRMGGIVFQLTASVSQLGDRCLLHA